MTPAEAMQRPPFREQVQISMPPVSMRTPSIREQQIREATECGWPIQETK